MGRHGQPQGKDHQEGRNEGLTCRSLSSCPRIRGSCGMRRRIDPKMRTAANGSTREKHSMNTTSASRLRLIRVCRQVGLALVVLLTGCASNRSQPNHVPATSRSDDITCPRCAMKHYVWDSRGNRTGRLTHHDIWEMECPDCIVRIAGIWSLIGPSHTCPDCSVGVERCPMCRAANRDDGKYPTSQPEDVHFRMPAKGP